MGNFSTGTKNKFANFSPTPADPTNAVLEPTAIIALNARITLLLLLNAYAANHFASSANLTTILHAPANRKINGWRSS